MVCSNAIGSWLRITAGAVALLAACAPTLAAEEPPHSAELDAMIVKEAQRHGVPERLVRRIVMRESRYNPRARNHKYWGLMQISYPTARSMGFKGTPQQLLNPLVNLTYAVPYLANAFLAAGKREDAAVRLYASGYYDTARHLGLLGQLRTADSAPAIGFHDDVQQVAAADSQPSFGIFGALLNPFDPSPAPAAASYAAVPPQDAPAAPAPSVPAGGDAPKQVAGDKGSGSNVNMVAGKAGDAEPPKKWQHDGGITVLARGEQSAGHAAAAASETTSRRTASRHTRKSTQFAAVDAPASAQAYAPSADGTLTPSQSAISDAMTAQGVAVAAGDPPAAQPAYTPAPAGMREASATTSAATDDKHAAKRKARKIAARHRAHIAKQDRAEPAEANGAAAADAEAIPAGSAEAVAAIRP